MANVTLETVVEQVKALTVDEQRELRQVLDEIVAEARDLEEETEWRINQEMLKAGLLSHMPSRPRQFRDMTRISVRGEPVSQTIIEERR